jgi:hypothetical protein
MSGESRIWSRDSPLWEIPEHERLNAAAAKVLAAEVERTGRYRAAVFPIFMGLSLVEIWDRDTQEKTTLRSRRQWEQLLEDEHARHG